MSECSVMDYIQSQSSLEAKIIAIDALIDAMMLKTLEASESSVYDEYQMDDGQMRVRTKYRSIQDVIKGIQGLEKLKQMYVNRLNGRVMSLRNGHSFFRGCI